MMRILLLSTWYPYPPNNGSKLRVYHLLRALSARHDVTALAFRPPTGDEESGRAVLANELPVTAVPDDPFRHVNASQWVRYLSLSPLAFRPSPAMEAATLTQAGHGPWDAAVAVQMPVAQYALQVNTGARIVDVDTALTFQMRERYEALRYPIARARAWTSWQKACRYESKMLRRFEAATAVCRAEAASLQQMVQRAHCRVVVIPNGVDCTHNYPDLAEPQLDALVYNGSLTYSANYDAMQWFLAEIYPRIKAQLQDVTLTITGSTKGVNTAGLALDDSVHLTGFVEDVRIPVAEATICVIPIRQGGGTRLKILEAMALGTPVVATHKGAEGLDMADSEHLLLADDPDLFAMHVIRLLGDTNLRGRLAANARRLVETRYDWSSISQRFVCLVEDVATQRRVKPARMPG
jgi:glycosyltransferase involved in cell wall biosynthesis